MQNSTAFERAPIAWCLCLVVSGCADPSPPIVVQPGKATTCIVEPLDEDGFVDYLEAANARHAQGITPENNWEVVLRRMMGPIDWDDESDREYYRRLGIPPVERKGAEGTYFQAAHELGPNPTKADRELDRQFSSIKAPWRSEIFPESARYLESQSRILEQIIAGSRVSGFYHPYAMSVEGHAARVREIRGFADQHAKSGGDAERFAAGVFKSMFGGIPEEAAPLSRLHGVPVQDSREVARVLYKRALLRAGEGDVSGAQEDLLAIRRIGRLLTQGGVSEWLIGHGLEQVACWGEACLLESAEMSAPLCTEYLHQLDSLPPPVPAVERLEPDLRYMCLDLLQFGARQQEQVVEITKSTDSEVDGKTRQSIYQLDWNQVMRRFNSRFDSFLAAAHDPSPTRRLERTQGLLPAEIRINDPKHAKQVIEAARAGPDQLAELLADTCFERNVTNLAKVELRSQAFMMVIQTALAARLYLLERNEIPTNSDAVSSFLKNTPLDPFSGTPIRIKQANGELVVYSVGLNQIDDGGVGWQDEDDDIDKDDMRVRLRLPP